MLCQLNYTHHIDFIAIRAPNGGKRSREAREKMVRQKGLEPPTYCLEGSCSIRMSYWRGFGAGDENRTRIPSLEGWCPDHCATPAGQTLSANVSLPIIAGFRGLVKDFRQILFKIFRLGGSGTAARGIQGRRKGTPAPANPALCADTRLQIWPYPLIRACKFDSIRL